MHLFRFILYILYIHVKHIVILYIYVKFCTSMCKKRFEE